MRNNNEADPGEGSVLHYLARAAVAFLLKVNSVVDWRKFYNERYIFVGKLVGRYYDSQGNPTKYLKGVEAKAKRGAQLLEKKKIEEAKIPSCNSRCSQQEGGRVWCDAGYPRLVKHHRHPFSLTSAPDDEHLSMHIRSLGDWSYQMYSIFQEVVFLMWHLYCICFNIKTEKWINWQKYPEFQLNFQAQQGAFNRLFQRIEV